MEDTPREKYAAAIVAFDTQWTEEMQEELEKLEEKYRNEQSDIENDRINEDGVEEESYLNDQERKRMYELRLIEKNYQTRQQILAGKITKESIDLYNNLHTISTSKSIFDI